MVLSATKGRVNKNYPILTLDKDFENYKKYIPIKTHFFT